MYKRIALGLLLLALGAAGALSHWGNLLAAAPADFLGTWVNTDPNTGGMVRLVVSQVGARYEARGFGACSPSPCDWGTTPFHLLGYNVSDANPVWGLATWDFGFSNTYLVVRREGDLLVVENYTVFKDGSGRSNYRSINLFRR
jgi:hypothetical protein